MSAQARKPVYLRGDQWALVDDILSIAKPAFLRAAGAGHTQYPDEVSRRALIWTADQVVAIRAEIAKALPSVPKGAS